MKTIEAERMAELKQQTEANLIAHAIHITMSVVAVCFGEELEIETLDRKHWITRPRASKQLLIGEADPKLVRKSLAKLNGGHGPTRKQVN